MISSVGIVIPTYQAAAHLPRCLPPLLRSPLKPRVLVIDSSSTDDTAGIASTLGAEVLVIPKSEFNHGATREMGRRFLGTSIIVMMTQDAYASSSEMLQKLISPLAEGLSRKDGHLTRPSVAYARQLPHKGAGFFGSFARSYNYPANSQVRSLADACKYGAYTFFCSNSCAAYLNSALDEIGGFPPVVFGEDTASVAKLLHRGHSIAYMAEAEVFHSHDYSLKQEFFRHYLMGFARASYSELLALGGSDSQRGRAYVHALLRALFREKPFLIPYALVQTLVKWAGYQIGRGWHFASACWK